MTHHESGTDAEEIAFEGVCSNSFLLLLLPLLSLVIKLSILRQAIKLHHHHLLYKLRFKFESKRRQRRWADDAVNRGLSLRPSKRESVKAELMGRLSTLMKSRAIKYKHGCFYRLPETELHDIQEEPRGSNRNFDCYFFLFS